MARDDENEERFVKETVVQERIIRQLMKLPTTRARMRVVRNVAEIMEEQDADFHLRPGVED